MIMMRQLDHKTVLVYKQNVHKSYHVKYNVSTFQRNLEDKLFANESDFESLELTRKMETLEMSMRDTVNELISEKYVNKQYSCEWYNDELKVLRVAKNSACMRAGYLQTTESWDEYRRIRNQYNRKINLEKNNSVKNNLIVNRNDHKKLWKILKGLTEMKSASPGYIHFEDDVISDDKEIAIRFNEYFVNSIREIHQSISYVRYERPINLVQYREWSNFAVIRYRDIIEVINSIGSKSVLYDVNIAVIKDSLDISVDLLIELFNDCLRVGLCPDVWKFNVVVPVPKISNTIQANEHRPVNMACSLDKVFQGIVKNQLEKHLKDNDIITEFRI